MHMVVLVHVDQKYSNEHSSSRYLKIGTTKPSLVAMSRHTGSDDSVKN